ncbi:hypothetical protein [Spirosoma aerolatum]|uniref:hypothetical protein n=1 Tax=Spirosoma aerolatum TaxID=1211326 RepID=UPI0012D2E859|nr:hypothetical protein [Spirosoma aerolatum]
MRPFRLFLCLILTVCRMAVASNPSCVTTNSSGRTNEVQTFNLLRQYWQGIPGLDILNKDRNHQPGATLWASMRTNLTSDLAFANVVSSTEARWRAKLGAAGAIELTATDFNTFAQPGNTLLTYVGSDPESTLNMVIGKADPVNAQTWTLPANLTYQLDQVDRRDFVTPASIPANLRIAGATNATKFTANNRAYIGYRQYQIGGSAVNFLGYSVDRKVGNDYETSSAASIFSQLPAKLGNNFTSTILYDDPDDDLQTIQSDTLTFDGFGTLNTPNGSFQALRYTIRTGLRTYDTSGGATPSSSNLIDTETGQQIGWVTKEGYWVVTNYDNYNPSTMSADLSTVAYSAIVATRSLSPSFSNSCNCPR